jgi:DNA mismatch endonuclease (patch repair protein)
MPDVFTKAKRSEVMSRIRGRGNKDTELALAKLLRRHGIKGWRRHLEIRKAESGKQKFKVRPDFVFRQVRLALFVDGCFWHGCPKHCKYAKWLTRSVMAGNPASPKNGLRRTGRAFWRRKLAGNKTRDRLVNRALRRAGWRVVRIWECDLAARPGFCIRRLEMQPCKASDRPLSH